ncbi:hypothetical protein QQ045_011830 [Rhodiola kirilowii]
MKRRRHASPHSRPPPQTPDTLLPNPSSPDSSESSVASSPFTVIQGKMNIKFMQDETWPLERDIILFEELRNVITQKEKYLGLLWDNEEVWEKIQDTVNCEAQHVHTIDDIKDRVQTYKKCYKEYGEDACRSELRRLVKDAFMKPLYIAPVIVPRSRSMSQSPGGVCHTTSNSRRSVGASTFHGGASTARGGASTARVGVNRSQHETLMLQLNEMLMFPEEITTDEFLWAVNYFGNVPGGLTIYFGMCQELRVAYIKKYANK